MLYDKKLFPLIKTERILFVFSIILSLFCYSRPIKYMNYFIGNSEQLSMYPLFLFSLLAVVVSIKENNTRLYKLFFLFFGALFVIYNIFNIGQAVIGFKYYDQIDFSQLRGTNKTIYEFLSKFFPFSRETLFLWTHIFRELEESVKVFYSKYFIAFSVFVFYRHRKDELLKDLYFGSIIPFIFICFVVAVEAMYFLGDSVAKNLLLKINSLFYEVGFDIYSYPAAFCPGRFRAVFTEPAYFSYWLILIIPIFLIRTLKDWKAYILVALSFCFLFLSYSRTGFILILGVLISYCIGGIVYLGKAKVKKNILILIILFISMYIASSVFYSYQGILENKDNNTIVQEKVDMLKLADDNFASLTSVSERSNSARYGVILSELKTFSQYPLFGVSDDLIGYHAMDNFPEFARSSEEVKKWLKKQVELGPLETGIVVHLCEYSYDLASYGIIGFVIMNSHFFVYSWILFIYLWKRKTEEQGFALLYSVTAFAGIFLFGFTYVNTVNILVLVIFGAIGVLLFDVCCRGKAAKEEIEIVHKS